MQNRIPPLIVMMATGSLMWVLARQVPVWRFELPVLVSFGIPLLFVLGGLFAMISGVLVFRKAKTTPNPLKPDSASSLVVEGIYRRTRNPMYLGMLLVLCGLPFYLGSGLSFIGLPFFVWFIHSFQILPEEAAMEKLFGEEFLSYKSRVGRWF